MPEILTILKLSAECLGDNAADFTVKCYHVHALHVHAACNINSAGLMREKVVLFSVQHKYHRYNRKLYEAHGLTESIWW
jgi:hypothetical protein